MTAQPQMKVTYAEYVRQEEASATKHEFINGEIFAMAGGTPEHGALALGFAGELRAALGGRACRAYSSDVRVLVESTGASFYPDLSVVCGALETATADRNAVVNPVVLVEVLSEGTEASDRGAKAMHYRRIPSLKEFVLVSQSTRLVEVQRRNERGVWELYFFGEGERVELTSLGISIAVDAIYSNPL